MRAVEIRIVRGVGFEDGVDGGQQHPANSNKNKTLANRTICFITFCAFRRKEWS